MTDTTISPELRAWINEDPKRNTTMPQSHVCDGSKSDCNKAINEILKLESRWQEMKTQIKHEISEMELGIGLPQCDQNAVYALIAAYEKVQAIMDKLEEK